jgi:hypothetical protein
MKKQTQKQNGKSTTNSEPCVGELGHDPGTLTKERPAAQSQAQPDAANNEQVGASPPKFPKTVSYALELTEEQQARSQRYLNRRLGNITLGQRWEALRRLLVNRLGLAVWDQQRHAKMLEESYGTDCWLEHAIGETVVRAYALGLIHSDKGHKAEKSSPSLTVVGFKPLSVVLEKDWQGEPADRRLCDVGIEALHQCLRDALPLRNGKPIIDKVRKEVARLLEEAAGEREPEREVIVLSEPGA